MNIGEKQFFGTKPQFNQGERVPGIQPLYHSRPEKALLIDVSMRGGYGALDQGLPIVRLAGTSNECAPYVPENHTLLVAARPRILEDLADGATTLKLSEAEAAKFRTGDVVMLVRDNAGDPAYHDCGAVVSVSTSGEERVVTFTTAVSGTDFTLANITSVYNATKDATNTRKHHGLYIMDRPTDTGTGDTALGGLVSACVTNAMLMRNLIQNVDDQLKADLSAFEDSRFFILR